VLGLDVLFISGGGSLPWCSSSSSKTALGGPCWIGSSKTELSI